MADLRRRSALADRIIAAWRPLAAGLAAVALANVLVHVFVLRRSGAVSGDRVLIVRAARERVAEVRAETDALERTASKLACARSEVARVFDDLLSSKEERMTSVQREVRQLATERGLDPDRISYKATDVKDTGLVRFSISFPLSGEYVVLEAFVQAVEESPNFLIVDQVAISEAAGRTLTLTVDLVTYFQAPDAMKLAETFAQRTRS